VQIVSASGAVAVQMVSEAWSLTLRVGYLSRYSDGTAGLDLGGSWIDCR